MISRRSLLRFLGLAPMVAVVPLVLPENSLAKITVASDLFYQTTSSRWVIVPDTELVWLPVKKKS